MDVYVGGVETRNYIHLDQRNYCSYFHRMLILLLETDDSGLSQHMHQYQNDTEQLLVNSRAEGIIYRRNQQVVLGALTATVYRCSIVVVGTATLSMSVGTTGLIAGVALMREGTNRDLLTATPFNCFCRCSDSEMGSP